MFIWAAMGCDCIRGWKTQLWLSLFAVIICVAISPVVNAQTDVDTTADTTISAQPTGPPPRPISDLTARDARNDHGHGFELEWAKSPDDMAGRNNVLLYNVLRTPALRGPLDEPEGLASDPDWIKEGNVWWHLVEDEWDTLGDVPSGSTEYEYRGGKNPTRSDFSPDYTPFRFKVLTTAVDSSFSESAIAGPVESHGQWYHWGKTWILIAIAVLMGLMLTMVNWAKRGKELYIRPLAGINAVDEAIGRATEMGRPILYILGLGVADEIATIASFTILSRVAKKVAEYQTELLVPCYDPIVMTIAQETVKQAYADAGRIDDYQEDQVYFVTQNQFAYVAAVNGTMLRRETATNFYLGVFYAESLILAETGSIAGSIQIAGTDRVTQLPFFVVACDYTLIGEELYAASAYLGREPVLLGTLKAQDYFKAIFLILLAIGVVAGIFNLTTITDLFSLDL